ncbi:TPA: hypothetical protein ACH3X2_004791 [Trebouxia sp. C0005]
MYICLLGLLPAVWSLLGYDSAAHMIEETKEADAVAGWPMPYAVALSGISGLPFLIALTLCIQDVGQLTDSDNGFDGINIVAQLLWQAYKTRFSTGIASLSLFAIPLGANFISALYSITSASRMLFGLSRDQAIPFSTTWQKVDESSGAPHCAVWGVTGASFILGLPLLNGVTAFSATTSIACAGLALTYSLPILLRILFRSNYLEAGPFTLGRWSIPVGVVACAWLLFETAMFMLPTAYPVTSQTFNYAPVAVGGSLVLIVASWLLSARFWFSGPKVDVDNSDAVRIRYWVSDPPRSAN